MSTSKTGRPSSIPVAAVSITGCEGGAVTGGNVEGSGPSSTFGLTSGVEDITEGAGAEAEEGAEVGARAVILGVARGLELGVPVGGGWAAGSLVGAPRSRGVYSVVNDGPGAGAVPRRH